MDTRMAVERIRALGLQRNIEGLRALLSSPDLKLIGQAYVAATMADPACVCTWAEKITPRDPETIELHETELDPKTAGYLDSLGIGTLGQASKRSDNEILAHSQMNVYRLEELRAIEQKYLGVPTETFVERSKMERIEKRVVEALARGETPDKVAKRLRLSHETVRRIDRSSVEAS